MPTYLFTWDPAVWDGVILNPDDWTCGKNRRIKRGDRLFLLRQGTEPRGMVASGKALTDVFQDEEGIFRVRMEMEVLLDAENEEIFPRSKLLALNEGVDEPMHWGTQISGIRIPEKVALKLESAWAEFLEGRLQPADEVRQPLDYSEGAVRQIFVNAYERNPEARRKCLEHYGHACAVCGMTFKGFYGSFADRFIHVHHLVPLSEVGEEYSVDPIHDLRPVCPNCHAAIHLNGQCRTIEDLQQLIHTAK
jgi:5-methylcytosine-specific restriction enzyme A